jgi:hypothetical protein
MSDDAELARGFIRQLLDEDGPPPNVDWDRFRLMQLIPGTAGVSDVKARDALIGRGFVELAQGTFDTETERRSLTSLRTLMLQIVGDTPRVVPGFANPLVATLTHPPVLATPPNLTRLLSSVGEILREAHAVTIVGSEDALGERMMTLLFVDGQYVGFLPATRALPTGSARA